MNFQRFSTAVALFVAVIALAPLAVAQSTDQALPTPVLANEIIGKIASLDLGDPRLTRHFYAFEGVPGDLLVNVTSQNLNGDIDIFTAITFRPIMKITMYASPLSAEITKSFYLRNRQVLILRVEARTPNDDPGTYHVRFGGAYEPFSGGIPVAEESTEQSTEVARTSGGRRLSSVGAKLEEPVSEPTPKPAEKSADETASSRPTSAKVTKPKSPRTPPPRTARGRPSRTTRSKPATGAQTKTEPARTEADKTETAEAKKEPAPVETKPAPVEEKPATPEKPSVQEPVVPQPGARLIIEEKDGTKIDRPMSTIRRVVVEGGTIVIVLKTGRIERVLMTLVAKMSIEP